MNENATVRKVLIVDDDALARMAASQFVKQCGHTAKLAAGGEQGLTMLRSEEFDLVLLDIEMPDMDGVSVLARMKDDPRLRNIPVLMVSGTEEEESIARCLQLGAAGHLSKPLNYLELADCFENFLS